MPAYLMRGQSQLSTEQANDSRIVTILRWVVEARNGHIKTIIKFFDSIIPRAHILPLRDFYLIAGSFLNRFRDTIVMNGKTPEAARTILNQAKNVNVVQARVEAEHLARRNGMWSPIDENRLNDFPIFDIEYLKCLTTGIYQLELAPSYVQDKLDHDGTEIFQLDEHWTEPGFIRIRIYSRFRNATTYQLWIASDHRGDEDADGMDEEGPILGYYCTCKTGTRTLGCCAHIASVLWYLGHARHREAIMYPNQALLDYIQDAANRWNPPEDQLNADDV